MNKFILGLISVMSLTSMQASAESQILADLGGESAIRFYEGIQPEHDAQAPHHPNAIPSTISEADMLPVVSHRLTPGEVQFQSFNLAGIQPMFLVGYDALSQQWLTTHKTRLQQLNAVGLVVNVRTVEELNQLRQIIPELAFFPVSGDDLAQRIPLQHYPVLITDTGVSQ